ncbi:N-acetylmuramoyl-L-alanine amidase [Clostridium sp. ZS2-4]|uniref:N-acetylmuramoyl-L-alanine amidase n=1 Tax=Clostridium sp. ZS2-4 TaxID=2987703 RepID=UPI00227AA0ED|nr:N-acetylmuramoyl-L-alanine amidase [Clostridium sp. ZS2-4]MCY6354938.1 N-acetylmuramoyl-L-alanine amidase [Clostridium sp. ZS2-4]
MKIAIRGGHNYGVPGASGILNEVEEDRKIYVKVIGYLKQLGHQILDVTPNKTATSAEDLSYGVSKANAWAADYFCSIHLNAGGGKGTEVLYYNWSYKGNTMATNIVKKIAALGFVNRGAKADTRGLYELRYTNMPANIIEVCFVDSQVDVNLYRKIGVDKIAKAIAEGITGQVVVDKFPLPLKVIENVQVIKIDGVGLKVVKEFKPNDLITAVGEKNEFYELTIGGVQCWVSKSAVVKR